METIYIMFIWPKIEYGCHIWSNCSDKGSDLSENFQSDIAKTICATHRCTIHKALYNELGWKSSQSRRKGINVLNFSKEILQIFKSAPLYLRQLQPRTNEET